VSVCDHSDHTTPTCDRKARGLHGAGSSPVILTIVPAVVSVTRDARASKTVVLKLVEELGFVGVDAGGLDESWRQPPGTLVTPTVCGASCMKRAKTALRNGEAPRTAPVASPVLLERAERNSADLGA
jgi:hypothetical protein